MTLKCTIWSKPTEIDKLRPWCLARIHCEPEKEFRASWDSSRQCWTVPGSPHILLLVNEVQPLSPEEIRVAIRFCETCDDDEGYDVPRPMMKRLEVLGLVVDKKFGRFEQTDLLLDIRDALEAEVAVPS